MKEYSPAFEFYRTNLLAKLKGRAQPLATHFGLDAFAYSRVTQDGYFYQITNTPDLAFHYWDTGLYESNFFLHSPDSYEAGFYLLKEVEDSHFQEMLDGCNKVGVDFYLRIVRKDSRGCHQFLYGSTKKIPFAALFFNNLMLLESFAEYLLEACGDIFKKCDNFTFSLPELLRKKYNNSVLRIPHGITNKDKESFFRHMCTHDTQLQAGLMELTKREKQCIAEFLRGKTAGQIASTLHISRRTAEHHLDNIKSKLGCSTKLELFDKLGILKRFDMLESRAC